MITYRQRVAIVAHVHKLSYWLGGRTCILRGSALTSMTFYGTLQVAKCQKLHPS